MSYSCHEYENMISEGRELLWFNPDKIPFDSGYFRLNIKHITDASERLIRFAPLIKKLFPDTAVSNGIIESPLTEIETFRKNIFPGTVGRLLIKRDCDLPVSGSVKARGGIYEVLKHTEELALSAGIIKSNSDDYSILASPSAHEFFSQYKIQVGSTGNLGLSIGIMSAVLGYNAIIHMSKDAKQWKKDLLRKYGATVIEYSGDYVEAVQSGRLNSEKDPFSYFVDDEKSELLFLGYSTAALRLDSQLKENGISVDNKHPLFVYLPCGVGGAPGGIGFGLKTLYGDNVHLFFAEPVQAPCMLIGLLTGKGSSACIQDYGLTGNTEADGLAVGKCSSLAEKFMRPLLSGEATVTDDKLFYYQRKLFEYEGIYSEPSSCAAFEPLSKLFSPMSSYFSSMSEEQLSNSIHIIWSTGGSMVPLNERTLLS